MGWLIDGLAAAIFAGSSAFAMSRLGEPLWVLPVTSLSFAIVLGLLRRLGRYDRRFPMSQFDLRPVAETGQQAVLLLDRIAPPDELLLDQLAEPAPMLLDDILDQPEPRSRVVQLFGASPDLPTAGELSARIDAHLHQSRRMADNVVSIVPDASAALHQALADIKRNLHHR